MLYLLQVLIDFLQIRYNNLLFSIILGQKKSNSRPTTIWGGGGFPPKCLAFGAVRSIFGTNILHLQVVKVLRKFKSQL